MKKLPTLEKCFKCGNKVFEFEDNLWGCDSCKSIWTFKGKSWVDINTNKKQKTSRLITIK